MQDEATQKPPRRVLVTGGRGFVGRAVLEALEEGGRDWEIVATRSPGSPGGGAAAPQWRRVDLLDGGAVRKLLAAVRPTHLIHLAWAPHRGIYESPENARWAEAGEALFEAFTAAGGRRAVVAGTCAEYDWSAPTDGVFKETAPLGGGGAYGEAKRALHAHFADLLRAASLTGVWARIFFLFGPHEARARLVPSVINALLDGRPAETTHGEQIRDYLYVRDAARALVALLESEVEGPVNVGSGRGIRLAELISGIARRLGGRELVRLGAREAPAGEAASVVADTRRLAEELGWQPTYELETAVAETIEWWRERRSSAGSS